MEGEVRPTRGATGEVTSGLVMSAMGSALWTESEEITRESNAVRSRILRSFNNVHPVARTESGYGRSAPNQEAALDQGARGPVSVWNRENLHVAVGRTKVTWNPSSETMGNLQGLSS